MALRPANELSREVVVAIDQEKDKIFSATEKFIETNKRKLASGKELQIEIRDAHISGLLIDTLCDLGYIAARASWKVSESQADGGTRTAIGVSIRFKQEDLVAGPEEVEIDV